MERRANALIRIKDLVQVMVGKDRGKTGKVLRILRKKDRVVVEKLNMVKRHTKPVGKQPGGIIEKEAPIHLSNVLLFCEKCNRGVRVKKKRKDGGGKVRVCVKCGASIDKG